jgi:hypothetical protein
LRVKSKWANNTYGLISSLPKVLPIGIAFLVLDPCMGLWLA